MANSIEILRKIMDDKVYVKFKNEDVFKRFLYDAETEGYMIGGNKPTEAGVSQDIKAIGYNGKISNCGIIDHIAVQVGGENIHVIDYEKYINGDPDYEERRI